MKTLAWSLVALVAALNCSAEVKVEEQVVGPAGKWVGCAVSPRGAHAAVLAMKGSRSVVLLDGVEGPTFDQLLQPNGTPHFPKSEHTIILGPNFIPVVFSEDGVHCAYFARVGDEYIAVLDGKEMGRGKCRIAGTADIARSMAFSPGGKHLYYIEAGQDQGCRVVMDWKPEPWSYDVPQVLFSPDGAHYAYFGTTQDAARKKTPWGVIDGKQMKSYSQPLGFSATGRLVSMMFDASGSSQSLLLDGKPVVEHAAEIFSIFPLGDQVAAAVRPKAGDPMMLTIDGKAIPGTENARIEKVYISPDGKHYAALCNKLGTPFMLIDGKKGQEYQSINTTRYSPTFTPDSSKFVFIAQSSGKWFAVVNDKESDAFDGVLGPFVGNPERVAYSSTSKANRDPKYPQYVALYDVVVDGQVVPPFRSRELKVFAFSPDGMHHAFACDVFGEQTTSLVVDGKDVPGVSVIQMGEMVSAYQSTDAVPPPVQFVFSPDGKHIAYHAHDARNWQRMGLWIDDKLIYRTDNSERPMFTPDSRHLMWTPLEADESGQRGAKPHRTLYIDGKPAVKFGASTLDTMPEAREMSPDGVLTLLAVEEGNIKRYRVTPSADTSVASLLAGSPAAAPAKADVEAAKALPPSQQVRAAPPAAPATSASPAAPAEVKWLDPARIVSDCMLVSRDARNAVKTQLKPGIFDQRYRGQRVKYSGVVDAVKKVEGSVIFKGTGKWPENYHVEAVFPPDKMSMLDRLQKGQRLGVEADITGFALPQMDTGIPGIMGPSRTVKLSVVTVLDQ